MPSVDGLFDASWYQAQENSLHNSSLGCAAQLAA